MMTDTNLRDFLEIPYDELEKLNLEAKQRISQNAAGHELQEHYMRYLHDEKRIKAVTICFSDIEGRFRMLDYDKKFLLKSWENLTFDGSSIQGFSEVNESDLRLVPDWGSFRWLPSDVFGPGKVIMFALIKDAAMHSYAPDLRGRLKDYTDELLRREGLRPQISVECEGFLFKGLRAEQTYNSRDGFTLVSSGGYFNSLPNDPLRIFIDRFAEAQRALGFENEKDHPEVAPSQFELNYTYCDPVQAADQLQLYKLIARQVAASMGYTASFLPKPVAEINGSGMHCNMSIVKDGMNLFYDKNGLHELSELGWSFTDRLLSHARELCLVMSSSANAYRRLDPHYEAPNQIKASAADRTSMVRIPIGNERSARIEVRTVAPDANPYLCFYSLLRTGLEAPISDTVTAENRASRKEYLPGNFQDGIKLFSNSGLMAEFLGEAAKAKYIKCKVAAADRSPRALGSLVKTNEILFHHEVTNQYLWSKF